MQRVATYNVHDCVGRDGVYDPERIARIVAGLDADVVALQEITLDHAGEVIELLESTTTMLALDGTVFERGIGRYGNVLLARHAAAVQRLHDLTRDGREPRGLLDAEFDIDACRWRVLATHLGLSWRERRAQLRDIALLIDRHATPGSPVVVLGDFNFWLGAAGLAPLRHRGFQRCDVASFPTFPWPFIVLDRVLVRGPVAVRRCRRVRSPLTRIASDHYPVVADVMLR